MPYQLQSLEENCEKWFNHYIKRSCTKKINSVLILSKMPEISSLPEEVLLHIFSFLPTSSLTSVWRTSRQWRDLSRRPLAASIQSSWADPSYYPDSAEVHCAAALVTSHDDWMLAASLVLLRSRHCVEVLHTEMRLLVGRKEKIWSSISSGKLEISVILDSN